MSEDKFQEAKGDLSFSQQLVDRMNAEKMAQNQAQMPQEPMSQESESSPQEPVSQRNEVPEPQSEPKQEIKEAPLEEMVTNLSESMNKTADVLKEAIKQKRPSFAKRLRARFSDKKE